MKKIEINNKEISLAAVRSFQYTGSIFTIDLVGKLVLNSSSLVAFYLVEKDYFYIGAPVVVYLETSEEPVRLSVLSFNFIPSGDDSSQTADSIELNLISPQKFLPSKTTSHGGNASLIVKNMLNRNSLLGTVFSIEDTADPHRRRYQIGINDWEFLKTLTPNLVTRTSPSFLYNKMFKKELCLKSFETLKKENKVSQIRTYSSNQIRKDRDTKEGYYISSGTQKFNEKKLLDTFSTFNIVKDLQVSTLDDLPEFSRIDFLEKKHTTLTEGYTIKNNYSSFELSPLEQYFRALREKFLSDILFNRTVVLIGSESNIDLGEKIEVDYGKADNRKDYLNKAQLVTDVLYYFNLEEEELFTKLTTIPIFEEE